MPDVLDELIEIAEKGARKNFRRDPKSQLTNAFIGRTATGQNLVIGIEHATYFEKVAAYAAVKKLFREQHVTAYCNVAEAWLSDLRGRSEPGVLPSEDPHRQEVIIMAATDGVRSVARAFRIVRDARQRVTDLVEWDDIGGTEITGPALDLLGGEA